MFGGSLHSGRSLVPERSLWAKMAEAASLAVGIDVLAGGTVLDDVREVERTSSDPRARSPVSKALG